MKTFSLWSAILIICWPSWGRGGVLVGPVTNAANGHLYYLLTQNHWVASEAEAVRMGGHLVTINDAAEQQWVFTTFAGFGGANRALWIGLNDQGSEGDFVWTGGSNAGYSNWAPGEPNGGRSDNAVHLLEPGLGSLGGFWNDIGESNTAIGAPSEARFATLHGVVEIDPQNIQTFDNGGFDRPKTPSERILPVGDTSLNRWVTGGTGSVGLQILPHADFSFPALDGSQVIAFNAGNQAPGATISQYFGTISNHVYVIDFSLGRSGGGAGELKIRVDVFGDGGRRLASATFNGPASRGWGLRNNLSFIADNRSATIVFTDVSLATDSVDLLLDQVRIRDVGQQWVLTNGLVAFYPFHGSANDASGTSNHCTVVGASFGSDRFGASNRAMAFGELGDHLRTAGADRLPVGVSDFTIAMWTKLDAYDPRDSMVLLCNQELDQFQFSLHGGSGSLHFYTGGNSFGTPAVASSGLTWNLGQWYHLQLIRAGNRVSFLRDGVQVGSGETSAGNFAAIENRPLNFGFRSSPAGHQFRGLLDDIRIYNRGLSGDEASLLYTLERGNAGPFIIEHPTDQTSVEGHSVTLTAVAVGEGPLRFQWFSSVQTNAHFDSLTDEVRALAYPGSTLGPVVAASNAWWPIVSGTLNRTSAVVMAARDYNSGRVVAVGHDVLMYGGANLDNDQLRLNTVQWLNRNGRTTVAFATGREFGPPTNLRNLLTQHGYTFVEIGAPLTSSSLSTIGVLLVNAASDFTPDEIEAVRQFVAGGGGLWMAGLGWWWPAYHPGKTLADYPMVKLAAPYAITWAHGYVSGPDSVHPVKMLLAGKTNATLTLNPVRAADAGVYVLRVSNLVGTTYSDYASIGVVPGPPVILAQPTNITALAGTVATLRVSAAGTNPLRYQWRRNNLGLVGQTNAVCSLSSVQVSQAGDYTVVITNSFGSVTSVVAVLTVTPGNGTSFAVRQLPAGYAPGTKFTVSIAATPPPLTSVYAVEDSPPTGWLVGAISHGGGFDALNGKVKYGPFFDSIARVLTYEVTPPAGAFGAVEFLGIGSAGGANSLILGVSNLVLVARHPADNSPGDDRMTIGEVTSYGAAWRAGAVWASGPNPIPISYVSRAGALWKGGEFYRMQAGLTNAPMWWVNTGGLAPQSVGYRPRATTGVGSGSASVNNAGVFAGGRPVAISVHVVPGDAIGSYAAQVDLPSGWVPEDGTISDGGQWDIVNGQIKFGPFFDAQERTLRFGLVPPIRGGQVVVLNGTASFDGEDVPLIGQLELTGRPLARSEGNLGRDVRRDGFRLLIQAANGREVVLESKEDLEGSVWTPIRTNAVGSVDIEFVDPEAGVRARRFYRVIER